MTGMYTADYKETENNFDIGFYESMEDTEIEQRIQTIAAQKFLNYKRKQEDLAQAKTEPVEYEDVKWLSDKLMRQNHEAYTKPAKF